MPSSARFNAVEAVLARLLRPRLHVGLVDLHDVGAGGEQVADLGVDGRGVVHRRGFLAGIEVVLRLLQHRERARHGDLDLARRCAPSGTADRRLPPHACGGSCPTMRGTGFGWPERSSAVPGLSRSTPRARWRSGSIALAADLAVGDDVQPRILLRADGEQRRVVLRLCRYGSATRHSSRARTRGGKRPASFSRSISHSGCGKLPTIVVGNSMQCAPKAISHDKATTVLRGARVATGCRRCRLCRRWSRGPEN